MDVPVLTPGTRLCAVSELTDGAAKVVQLSRGWPIVEVIIIRRGRLVTAYFNQCAHMPIPLNMLESVYIANDTLVCDHHYATFRIDDGYCTEGPCMGESLSPVPIAVRDGAIFVA